MKIHNIINMEQQQNTFDATPTKGSSQVGDLSLRLKQLTRNIYYNHPHVNLL